MNGKDVYINYPELKIINDKISSNKLEIDEIKKSNNKLRDQLNEEKKKHFEDYQTKIIKFYEQKKVLKNELKQSLDTLKYECSDLNNFVSEHKGKYKNFCKENKPRNKQFSKELKELTKKYSEKICLNNKKITELKAEIKQLKKDLHNKKNESKDELNKNRIQAIEEYKKCKVEIAKECKILKKELKEELKEIKSLKLKKEEEIEEYGYTFVDKKEHISFLHKSAIKNYKYNLVELKNQLKEKKDNIDIASAGDLFISKEKIFNYFNLASEKKMKSTISSCLIRTFIFLIPIILVGQLFIFINNVILNYNSGGFLSLSYKSIDFILIIDKIKSVFDYFQLLITSVALFMCIVFSYALADTYQISKKYNIISALFLFFIASSKNFTYVTFQKILGNDGLIVSIIIPIVTTFLFVKLRDNIWVKFKFKSKWDKETVDLINSTIEFFIVVIICSLVLIPSYFLLNFALPKINMDPDLAANNGVGGWSIASFLNFLVQLPVASLKKVAPLLSIILLLLIISISYYFGFNGSFIVGSLLWTKFSWLTNNGTSADNFYNNIINIVYIQNGGVGGTFGLLIAIIIFSKRKTWVNVSKIAAVFVVFQINEVLLFGLPIVFSPILLVPFILAPIVALLIAFIAISSGMVPPPYIDETFVLPWTTPPIIGALWITRWDYRAGLLSTFIIIVQFLIYLPFVLLDNKIYILNEDKIYNQKLIFKNKAKKILEESKRN